MKHDLNHTMTNGKRAALYAFETATEMADYVQTECAEAMRIRDDADWMGGTWAEADARARWGEERLVAPSDRLLDVMETAARLDARAFAVLPTVSGGAVNVPAMLAGHPVNMRQRRRVMSQEAPIAVLASQWIVCSADQAAINRRGAAVLALVRRLAEFRPVSLWVYVGLAGAKNSLTTFRVETSPLDLARAAWALSSPNVIRHFVHAIHGKVNKCEYLGGHQLSDDAKTVAALVGADEYIATPDLIGVGGAFETDEKAAAWVLENLTIHAGERLNAA